MFKYINTLYRNKYCWQEIFQLYNNEYKMYKYKTNRLRYKNSKLLKIFLCKLDLYLLET